MTIHRVRSRNTENMQKKVMRKDGITTHILIRKPIKGSPNQGEAPQIHLYSMSNDLVFHGPTLKKEGTIYKMTVYKINRV